MARSVSASGTGSLLKHLFTALDKIRALHHHDAPTAQAFDFDICADADNRPFVASAGMRFPHPDPVPQTDLLHHAHLRNILKHYTSPA